MRNMFGQFSLNSLSNSAYLSETNNHILMKLISLLYFCKHNSNYFYNITEKTLKILKWMRHTKCNICKNIIAAGKGQKDT